jgi:hypothetical protein
MKTSTPVSKRARGLIALAVLLCLAGAAQAFTQIEKLTGMVGITPGQTARLNVLNACSDRCPSDPCRVEAQLLLGDGSVFAEQTFMLESGKSEFLDLDANMLDHPDLRELGRLELRGSVELLDGSAKGCQNNLLPTLEIFDTDSKRTEAVLPAVQ